MLPSPSLAAVDSSWEGGAKLLDPGSPESSILSLRLQVLGASRMPPVASSVVDPQGTALIDAWIQGMTACP